MDPRILPLRSHRRSVGARGIGATPLREDAGSSASENRDRAVAAASAIVAGSAEILDALHTALRVADSTAAVLICGESGTGKELLARAIHEYSGRDQAPFVPVNCAAIPEPLLESELFGHEKGSFTGAVRRRAGRFERASGGTLFLDEVGDMSGALQAKILRALEEREVERVGGEAPVPIDVRLIAATNRDLQEDIESGRFRRDLYYRLAVVVITLPPLRERGSDIDLLAEHFLAQSAAQCRRPVPRLSDETRRLIHEYPWPGNIRELRNVVLHAVLLAEHEVIEPSDLPRDVVSPPPGAHPDAHDPPVTLREVERRHISQVLTRTGGNRARAAELLGIHRNTLRKKLTDYDLA